MLTLLFLAGTAAATPPNVLVIVADDLGVDKVAAYGVGLEHVPPTPNLDTLAEEGVLFEHAYAMPICSPTRATLQTGRMPWRHGVSRALSPRGTMHLPYSEITLAELLTQGTDGDYTSVALGKWHLGHGGHDILNHATDQGYAHYAGQMGDFGEDHTSDGSPQSYFLWEKNTDGELAWVEVYATTDTVNDAIAQLDTLEPPWLLWVAFNAPHAPWHEPPPELTSEPVGATAIQRQYNAMVEAMDTEIGRLLAHLDAGPHADDTLVVALGDNGTPPDATSAPFHETNAKGTVYEGGIRIPLIIRGPRVVEPGRRVPHLVQASDLFATVAEVANVDLSASPIEHDSVSMVPYLTDPATPAMRSTVYSETFGPVGRGPYTFVRRAVRDERYKLVQKWWLGLGSLYELYDLEGRDAEGIDLMAGVLSPEHRAVYLRLAAELPWEVPE
ncbi:MAG: arylsulfatase B [Myxococcota bacterium]|jgi:arylsulfatase B